MVACPRCGKKGRETSKEWDYGIFHVKLFSCKSCGKTFNAYFRKSKLSHTIPKASK